MVCSFAPTATNVFNKRVDKPFKGSKAISLPLVAFFQPLYSFFTVVNAAYALVRTVCKLVIAKLGLDGV